MGILKTKHHMSAIRLSKELIQLNKLKERNSDLLFSAEPENPDDIHKWKATIKGPKDSPYEGGEWELSMEFTTEYPFKPPIMRFITTICHPNIGEDGDICLDILNNE